MIEAISEGLITVLQWIGSVFKFFTNWGLAGPSEYAIIILAFLLIKLLLKNLLKYILK